MSLYNNIKTQQAGLLSSSGGGGSSIMGAINGGISSGINGLASSAANAMGGSILANVVTGIGANMATKAAAKLVNKHIPPNAQRALNLGGGVIGDLMNGDFSAAGMRLFDSGLLNKYLPGASGISSQAKYWGKPTPLFGGISPEKARDLYQQMREHRFAKKNLFLLEVSSPLMGHITHFNLFATDVDYTPFSITGDKRKVGGATVDIVQGSEPVEMRITTMDDQNGTLKQWFSMHHAALAAQDGTVGLPGESAITIKIVHSYIEPTSLGYEDKGLFRPASLEVGFSRREDALQELQMSFSQLDTFLKV